MRSVRCGLAPIIAGIALALAELAHTGVSRADAVTAPQLLEFVPAEEPSDAGARSTEASVVLRLDVDREGRVHEAHVVDSAGPAYDAAARAAVLKFRFAPAHRGETAVAARILYRYEFGLPASEPSAAAPAANKEFPAEAPVAKLDSRAVAEPAPVFEPTPVVEPQRAKQTVKPAKRTRPTPAAVADEVLVRGASHVERQRQSAESVKVVETEAAQRATHDLGEVLARTEGVSVRRDGGLGSDTRFSLNGLTGDQVRFFMDGVPLEYSGYPVGIANIPVNLVNRVEIYSGVVPVRFGGDALGGAVNLVTDRELHGTHGAVSYEAGSFDTHRVMLSARHHDAHSGLFARFNGFADSARNDYPIDVQAPNSDGQPVPARIYRFHDAYRAGGGNLELGVVERRFAKRLLLRVFASGFDKEIQHNVAMKVPYGGVSYSETALGQSVRYEQPLGRGVALDVVAGFNRTRGRFIDLATCVYDWFGRCVRTRETAGETDTRPHDQIRWEHAGFLRSNLRFLLAPKHVLRVSSALNYANRTGDERAQLDESLRDPLSGRQRLLTWVSGTEYKLDALEQRLENIAFVKAYVQGLDAEEPVTGGRFERTQRHSARFGVGNGVRYRFTEWLYSKLSYEWATRLPRPDEVFGDNAFIVSNLKLAPEVSHNVNAQLTFEREAPAIGRLRATVNGFLRETDRLIVLVGNERVQSYENVLGARALGLETAGAWTSPRELFVLEANATYQDFRNTTAGGTFGKFVGDRIPNRPYLFANANARLQIRGVATPNDELAVLWGTRYVHEFFRSWESVGLTSEKQTIPSQLVHSAGVSYRVRGERVRLGSTLEVQNLTNEPVYDFFGVQRPGRAVFVKTSADF